jgi:uncharacterized protein (DUF2336 family)
MAILSSLDVEKLRADQAPESRAVIAEKVAGAFANEPLSEGEREIAVAIFQVLANDAEKLVRQRLAESVKSNPDLPHDIAVKLAFDIVEVAAPIIRHSLVLTDEDLIAVVGKCSVEHSLACAQRSYLSPAVTSALVATNDERVILSFLGNKNAQVSESTCHLLIDNFSHMPRIVDAMSLRAALPFPVVERLITIVTEKVRERMIGEYGMTPNYVTSLMNHSREHLLLDTYLDGAEADEIEDFVRALNRDGLLTPTLILRAHLMGELTFVWQALARLAKIPATNAARLGLAAGHSAAEQLYDRCGLPAELRPLFVGVLDLVHKYHYNGDRRERGPFRNRVHEWGAASLGVDRTRIGFEQMISKLLLAGKTNAPLAQTQSA